MNLYDTPIPPALARELEKLYTEAESAEESAQRAEEQAAALLAYAARRRAFVDVLAAQIEERYETVRSRVHARRRPNIVKH